MGKRLETVEEAVEYLHTKGIREGIRPFFCETCEPADRGCEVYDGRCSMVDTVLPKLLSYLKSEGLVKVVEGELPDILKHQGPHKDFADKDLKRRILKAGYSLTKEI